MAVRHFFMKSLLTFCLIYTIKDQQKGDLLKNENVDGEELDSYVGHA